MNYPAFCPPADDATLPPLPAVGFTPVETGSIAAGATTILTFQGHNGLPFGVTRILPTLQRSRRTLVQTAIAGGSAGDHTVTGVALRDLLVSVFQLDRDATAGNITLADLTSEFTISAADTINNDAGTDTTGDVLIVTYWDETPYLYDFTVTAKIDGRRILFEDVHASTIFSMFEHHRLRGPIIIPAQKELTLEITNNGASSETVYVQFTGYTQNDLDAYMQWARGKWGDALTPNFVWVPATSVNAGASESRVEVNTGDAKFNIERLFFGSPNIEDLRASLAVGAGLTAFDSIPVDIVNDRFKALGVMHPLPVDYRQRVYLFMSNNNATTARTFSMLGETYIR